MPVSGKNFIASVATSSSGTFYELPAVSADGSFVRSIFEATNTTNAGYIQRAYGLADTSFSIECTFETSNTAYTTLKTAWTDGSELWLKLIPTGTTGEGKKVQVLVENYSEKADVGALVTVSISLQGTGAPVADNA